MNPEKKILLFIDWYLPGYKAGGPIRSCANLVTRLRSRFEFRVVTGDTDLDDTVPYAGIRSNDWNIREDGTAVWYFSGEKKTYANIRNLLLREKFDILYMNSFFSVPFTLLPLLAMRLNRIPGRVIIAPRGMMGKGSLRIKPLKKKLFILAARLTGLFRGVSWHASTPEEVQDIRTVFGPRAVIRQARNLTEPRQMVKHHRVKTRGHLKLFCLARISPVKNILAIFRYLERTPVSDIIVLHLYGTLEEAEYVKQCKSQAALLGDRITVEFRGPIENGRIQEMAREYHFMILPTMNENFGHAIVESLVAGCPVIISDRTPWKNLVSRQAGWDIPLEQEELFAEAIHQAAQMDQVTYQNWSEGASQLGEEIISDEEAVRENIELFLF